VTSVWVWVHVSRRGYDFTGKISVQNGSEQQYVVFFRWTRIEWLLRVTTHPEPWSVSSSSSSFGDQIDWKTNNDVDDTRFGVSYVCVVTERRPTLAILERKAIYQLVSDLALKDPTFAEVEKDKV
jgi:hypothetical protein